MHWPCREKSFSFFNLRGLFSFSTSLASPNVSPSQVAVQLMWKPSKLMHDSSEGSHTMTPYVDTRSAQAESEVRSSSWPQFLQMEALLPPSMCRYHPSPRRSPLQPSMPSNLSLELPSLLPRLSGYMAPMTCTREGPTPDGVQSIRGPRSVPQDATSHTRIHHHSRPPRRFITPKRKFSSLASNKKLISPLITSELPGDPETDSSSLAVGANLA